MPALENPFVLWLVVTAALAGLAYAAIRTELRVRFVLYGSFLAACVVVLWPPYERAGQPGKIKLGLDLRGGIHLVLQVVTDDALVATADDSVASVRSKLGSTGIVFADARRESPSSLVVDGVEPARVKDARDVIREVCRERDGWDVREDTAAGRFTVRMTDPLVHRIREQTVDEAIKTLERRVNVLGVAEPVIGRYGSTGDQILVQLPGVTDREQARNIIIRTALLALKLVEDSGPTREALLQNFGGKVPDNMEVVPGLGDDNQQVYYLVRREAVITGRDLKTARAGVDPQTNAPDVEFSLFPQGADRFARETGRSVGRRLAIILDGRVESAPVIQSRITDRGVITGRFSTREVDELAKVLRAGALPATMKYQQELTVGASLGKDSIRAGVTAAVAGMGFITLFMLFYYRLSGVNAIVALAANLLILLGAMAYSGATLTLPGIAGVILTIGVGVDTNVLVFERIREELRNGKTVRAAVANGFERVWITILDTHATALIAAAFLFQFGTGPIKGFAVTLFMGLVANVFASYFVSKFLFEWVLGKRAVQTLSI
ncbi:MAG: protein translocase subunit SecD [Acidobacteria bacterium]|nr:protein translocase subunit SecD [Acidobacteriota bacterium]